MSLFQKSVLSKYLKSQEKETLQKAYKKYSKYFHNTTIQENIKNSKEEEYQGIFLTELFVTILGYVLSPKPNFNLVAEYKNQTNSRKADGAILNNGIAIGVIELKGTKTKDLESIRRQAFDYKANQKGCVYVITSNFEKLRFYINDATEFEEFNLFTLTENEFSLLYLCLHKDNIFANKPLKIKEESVTIEEKITKSFYADYSVFKRELYRDLVKRNATQLKNNDVTSSAVERSQEELVEQQRLEKNVKQTLFKKSQKLIDRFLFIFFAEDRGLLPPNSTIKILDDWNKLKELDAVVPLYNRFKLYFKYLDQGRKGTDKKAEIYAYNGGLFKPDAILDAVEIDDDLLAKYTRKLANYDFESQVDVNILGHIFENSLNEIESVNAEIEGGSFDKQKSKRKKDGVFYTPKYITKYIVENTVGKLCEEKKQALDFKEEEYFKSRKNRPKTKLAELVQLLDTYRNWLLQLTICDPACGSGAFLNQALDFLIKEHRYIDELKANVLGGGLVFADIETTILENNIFGVDLNEESVEIAKLSLWLRTAQPRRKLNDLSSNIKCGNSLIDSKAVAGDKAFNWQEQFPQVFKKQHKKAYHITTAIHDSRTSARMVKYKVREKRELGTNPYPNVIYFTEEDDLQITQTIATIVKEEQLNMLAYNICADHIHLLLVCDIDEVPSIMKKIKGKTSFTRGFTRGLNPLQNSENKKPLWQQKYSAPKEITTQEQLNNTINYIQNNRSKHELPEHSNQINTIIDAMCCGAATAFNEEYKGGFDVVIGNPPYTYRNAISEAEKKYFKKNYLSIEGNFDLYKLFIEKTNYITKKGGFTSFIVPNTFLSAKTYKKLRRVILDNFNIIEIFDLGLDIFENVVVESVIYTFQKAIVYNHSAVNVKIQRDRKKYFEDLEFEYIVNIDKYAGKDFTFNINISNNFSPIIDKMKNNSIQLEKICYCTVGINTGYIKDELTSDYKTNEKYHKMLNGKDISRYGVEWNGEYIMYDVDFVKSKGKKGRALPPEYIFENEKILVQRTRRGMKRKLVCFLDKQGFYNLNRLSNIVLTDNNFSLQTLYPLLNSRLMDFYFNVYFNEYEVKPLHLGRLPINRNLQIDNSLSGLGNIIDAINNDLTNLSKQFQRTIQRKFEIEKLSKKLQDWYLLTYAEFVKELAKKKIKFSLSQEAEWEDYFSAEQQKAVALKTKIDQTDKDIDQMVYELYGLTEEEIKIIENA